VKNPQGRREIRDLFQAVFNTEHGETLLRWMIDNYGVFKQNPDNDITLTIKRNLILEFIDYIYDYTTDHKKIVNYLKDNTD
jgi:hypothetical protein